MATKVTMPQLGESVVEGTIGKWLVSVGQSVGKDEPLVEILTDKADSELPSPVTGVVTELFAGEDDIVAVGDAICEIDESAEASVTDDAPAPAAPDASPSAGPSAPTSPSVRKLAREKDVDLSDVLGSGDGGRIMHGDVMAAIGSSP
ncbi:MAG: biotin/lipoyl-containing protein, partial [Polyangiales bacterium]